MTTEYVWEILPKPLHPTSAHIIGLIWNFRRKWNPFGELIKHNARLCVHDGVQWEGVYFHNTFEPVLNCSTVKLIMMMAEMAGWESINIDHVLSFSKEPINKDVSPYLPAGFHVDYEDKNETYFWKLKKNLYGTSQAATNWFDMLKNWLEDEGFKQNIVDPCIFVKKQLYFDLPLWWLLYICQRQRDNWCIIEKSIKDIQADRWGEC